MIRSQTVKLPVGDVPDWEVDGSDGEPPDLKTPAESFVVLQSLKQSRDKWLRSMFPKFSSRGRGGKQPDVVPPPHTIYNRGRCTLQIGPHLFLDTTVFEVHYRSLPVAVPQSTTFVYQSTPGNSLSQHQPQASSTSTNAPTLLSPLSSALPASPSLISQVNAAATSNPTLANLLQLAASGQATPDQLKSLGLLIRSLSTSVTNNSTPQPNVLGTDSSSTYLPTASAAAQQPQYQIVTKEFDIVIEFREAPSDRWIFPRGPATYEFASPPTDSGSSVDLTVSTIIPFPSMIPPQDPSSSESGALAELPPKQVVEFHFGTAGSLIWDTFSRWVGPKEKMEEYRRILEEIVPPDHNFLAYRLSEGSQLTQIQHAALPSYAMKLIRPSTEGGRSKRRLAPRKSAQDPPGSPTAKRKRQAHQKNQVPPPKISCFTCGQVNVPLIMGGRYCRPCAEGGKFGETSTSKVNEAGQAATADNLPAPDNAQHSPKPVNPPITVPDVAPDGAS